MHTSLSPLRRWSVASAFALMAAAYADDAQRVADGAQRLSAEIRWTSYGVPHIVAPDVAGVGFGEGYALATLNLCEVAERWITVNAQRSEYFGPQARVPTYGAPGDTTNLQSDFFWQRVLDNDSVGQELREPPPRGPTAEVRELVRGYVAGYNLYLARIGVDKLPDPRCRGAAWVRPITEKDIYLNALHWTWFSTSVPLIPQFVAAAPPSGKSASAARLPMPASLARVLQTQHEFGGSNAIALGKDATDNGRGMLFGNPHWYWSGPERLWEVQLTVPGKLDVYGAAALALPLVFTGESRHAAWGLTVSASMYSTVYELKLVSGDPTSYLYDNAIRKLEKRTVRVKVKDSEGKLVPRTHEFWQTSYGLLIEDRTFPWTTKTAYALRDANTGLYWMNETMALDHAQSIEDIRSANRQYVGVPWINMVGADSAGKVFYDNSVAVPHVTNAQLDACVPSGIGKQLKAAGRARAIVLDGSRPACEWGNDPDTIEPGTFGPTELPQLERSDYVTNSNNSYWTTNPHQHLEGYPRIMGPEGTPRTLRTRTGLLKLDRRLSGQDGLPGDRFTLANLESITMNNAVLSGELWRDAAVSLCRSLPAVDHAAEACDVLAKWDLTENLDSHGAVLWRRFFENLHDDRNYDEQLAPDLFTVPFSPTDPINTPRGLNTDNPLVRKAFVAAIADLRNAHIPLSASLRNYQYAERNGVHIPIPGGPTAAGQYNAVSGSKGWVAPLGWPGVDEGSSFIIWTQFTDQGPQGRSILTYSQSTNPASPFFSDQTRLFSQKGSKAILFTDEQIAADPNLKVEKLCLEVSGRQCQ